MKIFRQDCLTCYQKITHQNDKLSYEKLEICPECLLHLPWAKNNCYRCGLVTLALDDFRTCEQCRENPPYFDRLFAPFFYQMPIAEMIMQLKFGRCVILAKTLHKLFLNRFAADFKAAQHNVPQMIIPMPLHKKRMRQRGYNQSYALARCFADKSRLNPLFVPVHDRLAWRTKPTIAQSSLDKQDRQKNIKDAFAVSPQIAQYQHVAILDDVVTTGATANALAKVIKVAGVDQVDLWCIARA